MAIDTLAHTKTLEAAGVARQAAEAQAQALVGAFAARPVTKADLDHGLERLEHRLTVRFFGLMLGVVGLMDAILFTLLRVVH
jgi:hypothetical protein